VSIETEARAAAQICIEGVVRAAAEFGYESHENGLTLDEVRRDVVLAAFDSLAETANTIMDMGRRFGGAA